MENKWQITEAAPGAWFNEFPELDNTVLQVLYNRGLKTQEQIDNFLYPDYSRDIHDPYLFRDMQKAVDRIYRAIEQQELIMIHGDYDADGVSASTILHLILENLGAKTETFLPHREKDGYGMNLNTIDYINEHGAKLIITCDCGISNYNEIAKANDLGIDTIITDHHQVPEKLPAALAIIHPKVAGENYPFKDLAGGGVAFKLVQGLLKSPKSKLSQPEQEAREKWLLDLVAISSVADMVSLQGENRTLVKYGLVVMKKNQRLGLSKLMERANVNLDTLDSRAIGFQIAPRINAAGRMDHANAAYILLIENDARTAEKLAEDLDRSNTERQKQTEIMFNEAKNQLAGASEDKILIFYKEGWPQGLTGLVAGRLVKHFGKPCFILTADTEKIVASGRSIPSYNLMDALNAAKDVLIAYGGHPQACGFRLSFEKLEEFKEIITEHANSHIDLAEFGPVMTIDKELSFQDIKWEAVDLLTQFEPFGIGNEKPLFVSRQVTVTDVRAVGKDATHLKLILTQNNKTIPAIAFSLAKSNIQKGDLVDIAFAVEINRWNGNKEIQLHVKDIKK